MADNSAPTRRAWGVLALVSGINLLNFADRWVVGGVTELIKRDIAFPGGTRDATGYLTDSDLGLLMLAFVGVLVIASPFTGWLGDRIPRRYLIFGGVLIWSLATFGSRWAPTFGTLLVARAFIGAGEAGYATVAPSLLSDLFAPAWRGKAMGVFNVMQPAGAAIGFGIGSLVGEHYGWRHAFLLAGTPGFILALLALALPEPKRGGLDAEPPSQGLSPKDSFLALIRNRPFVVNCAGQVLLTFTVGGLAQWMPSFFVRTYHLSQAVAAGQFGVMVAVAGLSGTALGTVAGEWAEKRRTRGYFWVSGGALIAAVPFILVVATAPDLGLARVATFVALFLVLFNTAPLYTALLNDVPAGLRGSAMAFCLISVHLLGDAISPSLVGKISDVTHSLAIAIGAAALPVLAGGVVLFGYALLESRRLGAARPATSA